MASVVGDLYSKADATSGSDSLFIASFFCQQDNANSLLARNIIGSIVHQLLNYIDADSQVME